MHFNCNVQYDKTNRFNTVLIFLQAIVTNSSTYTVQHENDQKKNKIKVEYKDDIYKKPWPYWRDFTHLYFIYSFFTSMLEKR